MMKNKQTKNDQCTLKAVTFITMQQVHYLMDIHTTWVQARFGISNIYIKSIQVISQQWQTLWQTAAHQGLKGNGKGQRPQTDPH